MGDESRFRYRVDEGLTRDSAAGGTRAAAQDSRRLEARGRTARDYARPDTSYMPSAPAADYRDDGYGTAPAKAAGSQDSLAELAKLIGDEDPFADFNDLDRGQGAQSDAYDEDDYDAPEPARFAAPVPTRGQTAARASSGQAPARASSYDYDAEPSRESGAYARPASNARGYDDEARGYRQGDARYDDAQYDASAYDAPRRETDYDDDRDAGDSYDRGAAYDDSAYGAPSADARDDYAPAPRSSAQLPARLSASREVAVPAAPRGTGAVRSGYGSLARQATPAPKVDDARDGRQQDARGYAQQGYDDRSYDDDGYEADAYDDRAPAGRGQDDRDADRYDDRYDKRGYDDRGYSDQAYDKRGYDADTYARGGRAAAGNDDRAYADQGYDSRGYDDRGYDERGYDDRRGGEAAYAYSNQRRDDDDGYDAYDSAYDPEFADEGYMPPHGDDVYEAEPRRRKGRMALLMAVSVIGLVVAGIAAFFAYRMAVGAPGLVSGGAPPVIRADASPAKIVTPTPPATDGQQKLIYDRVGGGANPNEHVVPREEQPVDVATASTGTTGGNATEPKRVRTLTVRADGSIVQDGAPSEANPAPPGSPVSAYAPNQNPIPAGLPAPTQVSTVPAGGTQTASTNPPVAASGSYVVQVASQRSEADAMGSWRALQTRYPSLLGSYRASVKRADLGERGVYYRAQVGPFASRDQANELCQALRAQGGDCLVSKI